MNRYIKRILKVLMISTVFLITSCEDLTEVNVNPNEITQVNSDLLLSTVLTETAIAYQNNTYEDIRIPALVQHLQQDIRGSAKVNFSWEPSSWSNFYNILRTNKKLYNQAVERGEEYYQGISLIMKSFLYGFITDIWGDCPYSEALKGDEGLFYPKFDDQQYIYEGILADLELANTLLSKDKDEYFLGSPAYDVVYYGEPEKWRKFANSLMLRYYMRLSEKLPEVAQTGVEKILGDPSNYPIFESNNHNAFVEYVGGNAWDSWAGGEFNWPSGNDFRRRKPCKTIVDTLKLLNDPRLEIWVSPVDIQIAVEEPPYTYPDDEDITVDLIRYIHYDAEIIEASGFPDTSKYVGLPANMYEPHFFNLATTKDNGENPHASYLTDMYRENSHELVNAVLMTYSELSFIKAEAAQKGWNAGGTTADFYNQGVISALSQYDVSISEANSYLLQASVAYNNSIERIMQQKWIALWLSPEAWFDYRRTGLPNIQTGEGAMYPELPLRFIYSGEEQLENLENWQLAIDKLEETEHSSQPDHHYSKMWVLQGTGKPY